MLLVGAGANGGADRRLEAGALPMHEFEIGTIGVEYRFFAAADRQVEKLRLRTQCFRQSVRFGRYRHFPQGFQVGKVLAAVASSPDRASHSLGARHLRKIAHGPSPFVMAPHWGPADIRITLCINNESVNG